MKMLLAVLEPFYSTYPQMVCTFTDASRRDLTVLEPEAYSILLGLQA
jgi:hypothetical protein